MIQPGSIVWYARHEARLAWRDWLSMMTGGHRRRRAIVIAGLAVYIAFMHGLAWFMSPDTVDADDPRALMTVTGVLLLAWSMMLSQALESVTRAFYARGDLELILSAPAAATPVFSTRTAAMAASVMGLALALAVPFFNVMIWRGGVGWLRLYAVAAALAMAAVAAAVVITIALFQWIGPRRTRAIAQMLAAVIGAGFAIGLQLAAILSFGTWPASMAARLDALARFAPDLDSPLWWPARAVLGSGPALMGLVLGGAAALLLATRVLAPKFAHFAIAAAGVTHAARRDTGRSRRTWFHRGSPGAALRRKEWVLLIRDPWLLSQTLMQLLYLLPAAVILWRDFQGGDISSLLVPVLIVAAGQLAGGLAWLAVSGEDTPDLIASAPITAGQVLRARTEAVLGCIGIIFAPFVMAMAFAAPVAALVTLAGVIISAGAATAIQYWFRAQARRSLFRRRQTSSRIATFAEALSSTLWAATGALAAAGSWFAAAPGGLVVMILACAWLISPGNKPRAA